LKIENSHLKVKIGSCPIYRYGTFLVANCSLIPKMYILCCLEVNFNHWRSNEVEIYEIFRFSQILINFNLKHLKLTSKQQNMYFFEIRQFATRKAPYPYIGQLKILTFIMRISNLQVLWGLPTDVKINKYAEIIFIFCSYSAKL
jgi:hypothetical protein